MAKKNDLKEVIEIINKYLDVLRKNNISFEKVYLFGSYVKGDFHEGSDIDLAIIANKWNKCTFETRYQLMKINNVDVRIEPHPFETSEFNKTHPFAYEIMRTGKLI